MDAKKNNVQNKKKHEPVNRKKEIADAYKKKVKIINTVLSILFFIFPILALLIPYLLFRKNFSPVLTEDMLSELAFVKYLVAHNSHTFADGWTSTKPFVPYSTRYFLTYYYTDFATWQDALLKSVTCVYGIFAASYIFFVTSFHAKKIYAYLASIIPAVILANIGLNATYHCSYILTLFCPILICLGIVIHGIRFKFPIPFRVAIAALAIIPLIVINVNIKNYKEEYAFDNSKLLTTNISKSAALTDITGRYTGLIEFLDTNDIPLSYCTDAIVNELTVISDSSVNVAPVVSPEDLTPVEIETDSYSNPYEGVSRETKPFYMIYDNDTAEEFESSYALKFGSIVYEDDYYTIYSYKNYAYYDDRIFQDNMVRLASEKYDSFYYSFLGSTIIDPGNFPVFSGTNPIFIAPSTKDYENINVLLDAAIAKEGLKTVFFEIDPVSFSEGEGKAEFEYINQMIEKYSNVTFYATLAYPETTDWKALGEDGRKKQLETYKSAIEYLAHNDNLMMFWPGTQKWLVESPENYLEGVPVEDVAQNLLVLTVCNRKYAIDKESFENYAKELNALAEADTKYPDLSDCEFVFMGDSIIGNYHGPLSIPGMAQSLSGSKAFNLGYGGSSAIDQFNSFVNCLTENRKTDDFDNVEFKSELERFKLEHDETKQLVFVISYGVNDYFMGVPARANANGPYKDYLYDSFESALSDGILKLKSTYPDAKIYVVAPIYCDYFESGAIPQSNVGGNLQAYRNVTKEVCEKQEVNWIDSNEKIEINRNNHTTFLVDGVHPTLEGLYLIGNSIIKAIAE